MRRSNRRLLNALITTVAIGEVALRPRRPADIYTISPADLSAADAAVQNSEQEWRRAGAVPVTDEQVSQALEHAKALQFDFDDASRRSRPGFALIYLHAVRLFVLTRLPPYGKAVALGGAAAVVCGLSLLSSPFLYGSLGAALEGAAVLTVCGFCVAAAAILALWPTESKRQAFQRLHGEQKEWRQQVEIQRPILERAWANHKLLQQQSGLYRRLKEAQARREELAALLASAKYQLIHSDWRSLRAEEFEHFLSRVFETLGYQVQLTKASGDQGADLLVTGKGRRVAVQAKGYADSVGNHSVMEVVAGMTFYQCDACAVVTNSRFTSTAEKLAAATGCRLIDGPHIPDLIEGHIY